MLLLLQLILLLHLQLLLLLLQDLLLLSLLLLLLLYEDLLLLLQLLSLLMLELWILLVLDHCLFLRRLLLDNIQRHRCSSHLDRRLRLLRVVMGLLLEHARVERILLLISHHVIVVSVALLE